MVIKDFEGGVISAIEADMFEATITLTLKDGRKLIFKAEGYPGTTLELFTVKKVKKFVEETKKVQLN